MRLKSGMTLAEFLNFLEEDKQRGAESNIESDVRDLLIWVIIQNTQNSILNSNARLHSIIHFMINIIKPLNVSITGVEHKRHVRERTVSYLTGVKDIIKN